MTYILQEDILEAERQFGKPVELSTKIEATPRELSRIRRSQRRGRAHDITLFIFKGDKLLFISKPFYPEGLYRAPSGAALPGESIVQGARREALEETGTEIELERYIMRIKATFYSGEDHIDWMTHVFKARHVSGEIAPRDKQEIKEAKLVNTSEVSGFNQIMLSTGSAGFRYRVFLTEHAMRILREKKPAK